MLSYWEKERWLEGNDFCIIGAGIVGIQCAIALKDLHPSARIIIIERASLPKGASTKNAGFACFGSAGELLSDIRQSNEATTLKLIQQRFIGLELLRSSLTDKLLEYKPCGSYELFTPSELSAFEHCQQQLPYLNNLMKEAINVPSTFTVESNDFGFKKGIKLIKNQHEGAIHTGKMMEALIQKANRLGIRFLWGVSLNKWEERDKGLDIELHKYGQLVAKNLIITTNAFTKKWLPELDVTPFRNQVIVTESIPDLAFDSTFHAMEGYVYFRSIGKRILIGGARHLFMEEESTDQLANTEKVVRCLQDYLEENIVQKKVKIDYQWSGILAGGKDKTPIIKQISPNVFCGVRLGGMGVAIGSLLGKELAGLVSSQQETN